MRIAVRTSWLPFALVALTVVAVDLVTKVLAVRDHASLGDHLLYNPELPSHATRALVCVATIAVVTLIARLAERVGGGPIPFTWIAAGLLIGGTVGNWSSGVIWNAGVPDFIDRGDRVFNLADFAIGFGMLTMMVSLTAYAIRAYVRRRRLLQELDRSLRGDTAP